MCVFKEKKNLIKNLKIIYEKINICNKKNIYILIYLRGSVYGSLRIPSIGDSYHICTHIIKYWYLLTKRRDTLIFIVVFHYKYKGVSFF
jgi:hypothetical protein